MNKTLFDQETKQPSVLPALEIGTFAITQDEHCKWNELIFEVNGQQTTIGLDDLHKVTLFLNYAVSAMNRINSGISHNPLWKGIQP